ncbi:MAG: histidinol dehydrogenase [Candidatus Lokiarchaeota archaeon]|nr:histidinol dehydrogenase [Candidatus Lokiarchaeota archaeon]
MEGGIILDLIRVLNSEEISKKNISEFIPRTESEFEEIRDDVESILNKVKTEGDSALIEYTDKFDGIQLDKNNIKISEEEIKEAYNQIDKNLLNALKYAKTNLIKFQEEKAARLNNWFKEIEEGVKVGQIVRSLDSVGIYIPGGRAVYPSTVLMAAAPAYVAKVKNLSICSPPQKNGKIAPEIIVAAKEFKIKNIFKVGGAQAIGAMAFGTETIKPVQKIIGPGNKWVNVAKQLVSNIVAIDTPAGPSEVLIIADSSADWRYVIVDLISQVEHDPENIGIVITDSEDLINKIKTHLTDYLSKSERKSIIKEALSKNSLVIKSSTIEEAFALSNEIAPEHLEILTSDPSSHLNLVQNAGAVFLGKFSPVPLGDYSAGTNHILPTGGNAKRYSGLSYLNFVKVMDVLKCNEMGLKKLSKSAMKIAEFEGLFAHKRAIFERLKE